MNEHGALKWRFDVSTFRLIGRDLITDRVTALFELVKNCYDANATDVTITFNNVSSKQSDSFISVADNGIGMSFVDIRDKWMVIGTSNKREHSYTPEPIKRRCVGEKGIGRFAVDKLGDIVNIRTKQINEDKWLEVVIDWNAYFDKSKEKGEIQLFTDVENKYSYTDADNISEHGTRLLITGVREAWAKGDIMRFISEISKIVSPFADFSYPFKIRVIAPEFNIDTLASRNIDDVNIATLSFTLDYNTFQGYQEVAKYNELSGNIEIDKIPLKSFGGIRMRVYYFDETARRKYRKDFPNNQIDGIKIYRDGVITTPFAENEHDDDKKRDILGIDKRIWMNIFDRVSSREIIGLVEITKEGNPLIIDATNRQDFVDNEEYKELKDFIIKQLDCIENYKKYRRKAKKKESQGTLEVAGQNILDFISSVESITRDNPNLKESFAPVIEQAKKTGKAVRTAIKEKKEAEEEFARKENIYMSIMSLQEYAIHITHAVRTTLNKIRDRVEYFDMFFPDQDEEDLFKRYAKEMFREFKVLNRVIDYMLSYSQSNLHPEDIELNDTIREIYSEYAPIFTSNQIMVDLVLPGKITLKDTRKQFFRDIFQNLLDNSVKAVRNTDKKIVRCEVVLEKEKLIILVSDTGYGIPVENRQWVFGIYNTTTQEQGGAGIGLYIVKTRVESLKGHIEIIDSEFGDIGTTVKIELPFKK